MTAVGLVLVAVVMLVVRGLKGPNPGWLDVTIGATFLVGTVCLVGGVALWAWRNLP